MHDEPVLFQHNIGVQSSDFEEARCFLNSRIDEREISPLSAHRETDNLITFQPLTGTMVFGAKWSEKVHIQSDTLTTFHAVLVLSGCIHCQALNTDITANNLLLIAPGRHADLVWEQSTRAIVITLSRQGLMDHLGISNLQLLRQTSAIIPHNHRDTRLLRNGLECLSQQHNICNGDISQPVQKYWEGLLLAQLSDLLYQPDVRNPVILPWRIRLATEWILAHIKEPMSVFDVLRITSASRRSLESGFRTYLNTTPARFILCHKLKGVRETLQSDSDIGIGDAAFAYGFNHLSHFTQQYQKAFGELPSETIRHSRGTNIILNREARYRRRQLQNPPQPLSDG